MAGQAYRVVTHFEVDRRIPGLRSVHNQLRTLNSSVNQVTRSFVLLASIRGITNMTRAVANLNSEIQNAEVAIGATFSAITATPFERTIRIARRELRLLRQDAARLPGEVSDFVRTYQQISGAVLRAGGTPEMIRRMTSLGIVGATAVNPLTGMRNIGFDITQALTSGANARTTRDLALLLDSIGITVEAFNALSRPERLRTVVMAFEKYEDSAEQMGRTWAAQTATFRDNFNDLIRITTRPLFDELTEDLLGFNDAVDKSNTKLSEWARIVGDKLVGAYRELKKVTPESLWNASKATVGAGGALGMAGPFISSALGGMGGAVAPPATSAAAGYLGGSATSVVAQLPANFRQVLDTKVAKRVAFFEQTRRGPTKGQFGLPWFGRDGGGSMKLPGRTTVAQRSAARLNEARARILTPGMVAMANLQDISRIKGPSSVLRYSGVRGGVVGAGHAVAQGVGGMMGGLGATIATAAAALAPLLPMFAAMAGFAGAFVEYPRLFGNLLSAFWDLGKGIFFLATGLFKLIAMNPIVTSVFTALADGIILVSRVVGLTVASIGAFLGWLADHVNGFLKGIGFDLGVGTGYDRGIGFLHGMLDRWSAALGYQIPSATRERPAESNEDLNPTKQIPDTTNNFNGPISITIKPEKIDNPNLLARDMESVFRYLAEYKRGGRASPISPRST